MLAKEMGRPLELEDSLRGSIFGTSVGDSLGLPFEGMSRGRVDRFLRGRPLAQRLIYNRGMYSDDTEHTLMVANAIVESPRDPERFARSFANGLKRWLLLLPGGIGWATLRACVRLWMGFSPSESGVWSAGNGPAMRAAIIGVAFGHDPLLMCRYVRASTRVTHVDPLAEEGALAIALAAHMASAARTIIEPQGYFEALSAFQEMTDISRDAVPEFLSSLARAVDSLKLGESTRDFVHGMKWSGVSGYILHAVTAVIHCWLSHQEDFRGAMDEIIALGGDTDTTAAILGGIIGSRVGAEGIPDDWLMAIAGWPQGIDWMENLSRRLSNALKTGESGVPARTLALKLLGRNIFFVSVLFIHQLRRLLPPY
jgi:ADP-ribosyl-[dinitrogen reductase] hydrolase